MDTIDGVRTLFNFRSTNAAAIRSTVQSGKSTKKLGEIALLLFIAFICALITPTTAYADSDDANNLKSTEAAQWLKPLEGNMASDTSHTAYCRFGVNMNTLKGGPVGDISKYDLPALGVGWYIDYQAHPFPHRANGMEYAPMIRVKASNDGIKPYTFTPNGGNLFNAVANNPGADWFIGNEPDRRDFQDGVDPEIYATAYHEVYSIIKNQDPTAQIFAGSIVQPTEVRLEYLDAILASYQAQFGALMPVDGWSIHNFILNEADCDAFGGDLAQCWGADMPPATTKVEGMRIGIEDHKSVEIFKQQILRFRQWMVDNGYSGKPVYLSEYGVLLPDIYGNGALDFSPTSVNQFMSETFDYMLNAKDPALGDPHDDYRLIQRFSWYSVNDRRGVPGYQYNGNLFMSYIPDDNEEYTPAESQMGQNYREYTTNLADSIDIYLADVELIAPAGAQASSTTPITYTVKMTIANSGNLLEASTVTMKLFDDSSTNGGQQIVPDFDVTLAGCGEHVVVESEWLVAPASAPADTARFRAFISAGDLHTFMPLINN